MQKTVWITSLTKDEKKASTLFSTIHNYGLATNGHFWVDDLEKMAWSGAAENLLNPETAVWLITGAAADFAVPSVRKGLSLLALLLAGQRGHGFPTIIAPFPGEADPGELPTPLKGADHAAASSLGAKLAAKANIPWKPEPADYRLKLYPLPGLGLWFEAGPAEGHAWKGALFGVSGAEAAAHGVGPQGKIPERSTLEYPFKGMKLAAGEREYQAWGLSNAISAADSYFVKVTAAPEAILFGELPQGDEPELYSLNLV